MADLQWIKLSLGLVDDDKVKILRLHGGYEPCFFWIELLILAGKKNNSGEIYLKKGQGYTCDALAAITGHTPTKVSAMLQTLCDLEMVEITDDGAITIVNWGKYQNEDALDKYRITNKERQKRFREKRVSRDSHVTETPLPPPRNVTDNVMRNVSVTPTLSEESRKKKEDIPVLKITPTDNPNGLGDGVLEKRSLSGFPLAEAKARLNTLWGRPSTQSWSFEEMHILCELCPTMTETDLAMIEWFFGLPAEQAGFRSESLTRLLQNWNAMLDKARAFRAKTVPMTRKEPPDWQKILRWTRPDFEQPKMYLSLEEWLKDEIKNKRPEWETAGKP